MYPVNNGAAYEAGSTSYSSHYSTSTPSRGPSYPTYEAPAPRTLPSVSPPPPVLRTPSPIQRSPSPMEVEEDAEPDYTSPYDAEVRSRYLPRAPPYSVPRYGERHSPRATPPAVLKLAARTRPPDSAKSAAPASPTYSNGYW
ncbi:hypothetical protein BD626DRAFT_501178, partial [Schizophyllum amplum]